MQELGVNKPKCLFVSNVLLTDINGAANSLRTFLQHQTFLDIDLILPLFIFNIYKWPKIIRQNQRILPQSVTSVSFFLLPWSRCFEGSQTSRKAITAYALSNVFANFLVPILKLRLKRPSYRFVYLNSLSLNRLISSQYKILLHVREVLDAQSSSLPKVVERLQNAAGQIFIDSRTRDVFQMHINSRPQTVAAIINNPFDMHKARRMRQKNQKMQIASRLHRPNETIFTFIGAIDKIKGVDFIIEAFLKAKPRQAKLYIVGSGNSRFFNSCKALAARSRTVVFFDRLQPDAIMEIYAASDYVLRGDPDFRIGRTIFEALYTGCRVILPNDRPKLTLVPELSPFKRQILFYKPRDVDSLGEVINRAVKFVEMGGNSDPSGNIRTHCQQVETLVKKLLSSQRSRPSPV